MRGGAIEGARLMLHERSSLMLAQGKDSSESQRETEGEARAGGDRPREQTPPWG